MPEQVSLRGLYCRQLTGILRGEGSLAGLPQLAASLSDQDRALLQEWCFGVCRWYHRLDSIASSLLEKPLRNKDQDIHCLILLGLYQLFFMHTPDHAAVNEAVAAAGELHKPWATRLINAVLRTALRNRDSLEAKSRSDYSCWYSHPEWLLQRLKFDWPQDYRCVLEANNVQAPLSLRVNCNKITREHYCHMLAEAGISARTSPLSPTGIILQRALPVGLLPGFLEGLVSVQDETSQLVSQILPLQPGVAVLDACAAPGGKTCAILEKMPALQLLALDVDARRINKIQDNLTRLGLSALVECRDFLSIKADIFGKFDCILLDAPCSGTGVIRRHPDIKLLRTEIEVQALLHKQAAMLRAAWSLLREGGYLLYSTCSILKDENQHQVSAFLVAEPSARLINIPIEGHDTGGVGLQLLPQPGGHDGFYYALLQKY